MLQSILLAVDASPASRIAGQSASFLSQKLEGAVHAVHVLDSRSMNIGFPAEGGTPSHVEANIKLNEQVRQRLEQEGKSLLDAVRENADAAGIKCRTELRTGVPAVEILEAAIDCDIIVMGRRGESSGLGDRKGLGEVADRILRTASQPVLLAGAEFQDIHRILLGFDGSNPAREAMVYAAELAQRLSIPLHAVGVHRDEATANLWLETVRHYADAHKLDVTTAVDKGDPDRVLLELAEDGDLITIGAFGEGRIREWLLGSTTELILRSAKQPVLLHR